MTPNPATTFSFRGRSIRITNIRIAALLSLLLHALMFWNSSPYLMRTLQPFEITNEDGKPAGSLAVRLVPPTSRHADEVPMLPRAPVFQATRSMPAHPAHAAPTPPSAPRMLASERPSSSSVAPQPKTQQAPGDLAAYVEARRREREPVPVQAQPSPPAESQQERDDRQAAENLGFSRVPTFGAGRQSGGGIFQVQRVAGNDAEFFFFGWNKMMRRNMQQMIEVRRGDSPSIEVAVVRRMIAIIREQTPGDFIWESPRTNRQTPLSARPADNAGLEDFLLREFFPDYRR